VAPVCQSDRYGVQGMGGGSGEQPSTRFETYTLGAKNRFFGNSSRTIKTWRGSAGLLFDDLFDLIDLPIYIHCLFNSGDPF